MYDVIIVGAGPAGISAGLYAGRSHLKVLIFHQKKSALEKAKQIENYYGLEQGIEGKELYEKGIQQVEKIGVGVKQEEVIHIESKDPYFSVRTQENEYETKTVILATGIKQKKPAIEGIEKWEGKGVSYCAICDGFFYRNKNIAVIGNGNYALSELNELLPIAKNIHLLTNGEKPPEFRNEQVKISTQKIKEIEGEKRVQKVNFEDGSSIDTEGIFVAEGIAGSVEFAKKLGIITRKRSYDSE